LNANLGGLKEKVNTTLVVFIESSFLNDEDTNFF